MNNDRKKLSDILAAGNGGDFRNNWNNTVAADDFAPLPSGEYTFRILTGELFNAKTGTAGYKLTLEVTEGEYEGRRAWHDLWLTPAALPMTKRDLAKIGVTSLEQLEQPLPAGILIRGKLALKSGDDGNENNQLRRFECIGVEPGDAFSPDDGFTTIDDDQAGTAATPTDAKTPVDDAPDFPFGANVQPPNGTNGAHGHNGTAHEDNGKSPAKRSKKPATPTGEGNQP